ncbi:MAG: aldehyde oxidase and xanthine dehydrogenase molybdopterin binding protein [Frankiales bacterium]|nr:aldehyde oxidase and xanthine dehydrogenase molybdopterin binding protein [Frankiales bacterium]
MSEHQAAGRYVGQSVRRREDLRLITGNGRYVEDVAWPGTLHVAFLRSPVARGKIAQLDVSAAQALDGVIAVYTGKDLNYEVKSWWQTMIGPDAPQPPRRLLAEDDVRWTGEALAMVIATSRYVAEDGVDLIDVDFDTEQAVLTERLGFDGVAADTENLVHPEWGSNVAASLPAGNPLMPESNPALEEIFASAAHVVTETFNQHRYICVPMESRGIIASWDPYREMLEIVAATQSAHEIRSAAGRMLGLNENKIHAVAEDVGGGFGQKMYPTAEELAVIVVTYKLSRPVRWIEDRNENLLAGGHARREDMKLTMATDSSGKILGVKAHHREDVGSFPLPSVGSNASLSAVLLPGPYDFNQYFFSGQAVFTNTNGKCAYRGPWMMESVAREQMVDVVAAEIGMDPLEFRRRNIIQPDQLPYTTATGLVYESVTPHDTLEQAAEMIGYDAFRIEQAAARENGRLLGIGLSMYIEASPGFGILGAEQVNVRVDYGGTVLASTGTGSHGQSVETTIAQVVAENLGVDFADVKLVQGDTATSPFGSGTGGSRTASVFGGAAKEAALLLKQKVLLVAAEMLEADPSDLEMDLGVVSVAGNPEAKVTLEQVAAMAYAGAMMLPEGMEPGLDVTFRIRAPLFMYSNATHAAIVEIDPASGAVKVLRYVVSEDCGNMINPMVVEGQIAGGVVQGIGGVFYENFVYDTDGNPLTTTFLDYLLPTASEVPIIEYGHVITPSPTPGGFKPMGEGGAICSPAALINAVRDALTPFGAKVNSQPLGPQQVVDLMEGN